MEDPDGLNLFFSGNNKGTWSPLVRVSNRGGGQGQITPRICDVNKKLIVSKRRERDTPNKDNFAYENYVRGGSSVSP